jgi:hypothetical protein
MQIKDTFVRGLIWTFHSIGTGKTANSTSVKMFRAWGDQQASRRVVRRLMFGACYLQELV